MKPVLQPFFACLTACVALAQRSAEAPALPDEEDVPEAADYWDFTKGRGVNPAMLSRLDFMVPDGRSHEGLRYPVYGQRGANTSPVLESIFESKRLTRMDRHHLQFEGMVFKSFGDPKSPDLVTRTVSLQNAVYDLQNDLLFTNAPVQIDDQRGRIQSGGMLHDHATGLTIFTGGVRLYPNESSDGESAATPSPVTTPNPQNTPTQNGKQ